MERVYYIDHVSNDDINALSLKLNSMQEVSHIKINKDSISFNCARPDNIQNYLDESKMDYVLQEMVNRKKREYGFLINAKVEKIFHVYEFGKKKMHTKYKTFFLNIVFMKMFN